MVECKHVWISSGICKICELNRDIYELQLQRENAAQSARIAELEAVESLAILAVIAFKGFAPDAAEVEDAINTLDEALAKLGGVE